MRLSGKAMAGIALLALFVAVAIGVVPSTAATESKVGYVNKDLIIQDYAGSQIAAVVKERDRLQEKFDTEVTDLDETGKKALFDEYEAQLKEFEQGVGIQARMAEIETAMDAVAQQNGVTVILDQSAVVYGGINLTEAVLRRLGENGE